MGNPESAVAQSIGIIKQSDNQETQQDNVQSDEQATSTSQSVTNENEAQRLHNENKASTQVKDSTDQLNTNEGTTDNIVTHQSTKHSVAETEEASTTKHLLMTLNQFQLKRSNLLLKHKNRLKTQFKKTH